MRSIVIAVSVLSLLTAWVSPVGAASDVNVRPSLVDADGVAVDTGTITATSAGREIRTRSPYELALDDGTWTLTGFDHDTSAHTEPSTVEVVDGIASPAEPSLQLPPVNLGIEVLDADGTHLQASLGVRRVIDGQHVHVSGQSPLSVALLDGSYVVQGSTVEPDRTRQLDERSVTVTDGVADPAVLTYQMLADNLSVVLQDHLGDPLEGRVSINGPVERDSCCSSTHPFGLPDGTYQVTASTGYPNYRDLGQASVTVSGGVADPAEVVLQAPEPNVTVNVVDSAGVDVEGGHVEARSDHGQEVTSTAVVAGSTELWLEDGRWTLRWSDGRSRLTGTAEVTVSGGVATPATVDLAIPAVNVEATLVRQDGGAVESGGVSAEAADGARLAVWSEPYELALPDGTWQVTGSDSGVETAPTTVEVRYGAASPSALELVVPPHNLTVTYVDRDGTTIDDGRVEVDGPVRRWSHGAGPHEFALPDGSYEVTGHHDQHGLSTEAVVVEVVDGVASPSDVELRPPDPTMAVRVVDQAGDLLGTGRVLAQPVPCCQGLDGFGSRQEDGVHELVLQDATWDISWADEATGQESRVASVEVIGGTATPDVLELVAPPTNIVVEAVDAGGGSFDAYVSAAPARHDFAHHGWSSGRGYRLPDGHWDVWIHSVNQDEDGRESDGVRVEVVDGVASPDLLQLTLPDHPLPVTLTRHDGGVVLDLEVEATSSDYRTRSFRAFDGEAQVYLTDGTWDVRVNGLPPERVEVVDGAPDVERLDLVHRAPTTRIDVSDPSGQVQSVLIHAQSDDSAGAIHLEEGPMHGAFFLPDGTWTLQVVDEYSFNSLGSVLVTVADGVADRPHVDFEARPINLTAEVLDADGHQLTNVEIAAYAEGQNSEHGSTERGLRLLDGVWRVVARDGGDRVAETEVVVTDGVADPAVATLQFAHFNLNVTATGEGSSGALFSAVPVDGCCESLHPWGNDAGTGQLALPDGTWLVYADDFASTSTDAVTVDVVDGVANPSDVTIAFPGETVTVEVTDESGGTAAFDVRATADDGRHTSTRGRDSVGVRLADGTWSVRVVLDGTNVPIAERTIDVTDGVASPAVWTVTARAPNLAVTVDELAASLGLDAHAQIVDVATGDQVESHRVPAEGLERWLPDGAYDVTVRTDRSWPQTARVTVVDGVATPGQLHFGLPPANLLVDAYDEAGGYLQDGTLQVTDRDTGATAMLRPRGPYELHLPDGRWTVRLQHNSHGTWLSDPVDVEVTDGMARPAHIAVGAAPDVTPPQLTVTEQPPASTTSRSARIAWEVDEPALVTCQLDGRAIPACTSPQAFDGLASGEHTFLLDASDGAGNRAATTTITWEVIGASSPPPAEPSPEGEPEPEPDAESDPDPDQEADPGVGEEPRPDAEPEPSFSDVPEESPFRTDIAALADAGVTMGCNPPHNDEFCPQDPVTRGQMAALLRRALGLPTADRGFLDVGSDHLFAGDIAALAASGITAGCNPPSNDRYCPDDLVTRGQMAAFLRRALQLPAGTAQFVDVPDGHLFTEDIAALADAGITRGCNPPRNDEFCPDAPVTREQMAAFLNRAGLLG